MKTRNLFLIVSAIISLCLPMKADAQFDFGKALSSGMKSVQALTITDKQIAQYAHQSVEQMDRQNKVASANSEYAKRLGRLTAGLDYADGIPLNFKVYEVKEVNAFACPDGSVRVYSALMDIMTDDELLGVIGHEIGHVAKHHSKKQMKQQLLTGALRDALSSAGGTIGALSDSQLGAIGQSLAGAKYSQKQEKEADDYGYDFLVANGRNPWGMIMSFEKLQGLEGASSVSYIQRMFSSHPDTKSRINRLTKRAKKDKFERPL